MMMMMRMKTSIVDLQFVQIKDPKQTSFHTHCISIMIYIYVLLTKREVKMAGYWPCSFAC